MNINANDLTAAVLCSRLANIDAVKNLSAGEWHKTVLALDAAGYNNPDCLLMLEKEQIKAVDGISEALAERIFRLIDLRYIVENELHKLEGSGVSIVGMDDADYPNALVSKLGTLSPPLLFCVGNRKLLCRKGIAVTGSRKANDKCLNFARYIGKKIANEKYVLISGGAAGCDSVSEYAATSAGGSAVLYVAKPLSDYLYNARIHKLVESGRVCLVWDRNPDEPFSAGGALGRNKYIYCAAEASIVVSSVDGKGGSFSGAAQSLNKGIRPIFSYKDGGSGNDELIRLGAYQIDYENGSFDEIIRSVDPLIHIEN